MDARPATAADLDALVELHRAWDTDRFGAPEHDAEEVRETLGEQADLPERSRLLIGDGRLLAAAWHTPERAEVLAAPDLDPAPLYADLLPWLAPRVREFEALATDEPLRAALGGLGWTHHHSSFELIRAVSPDWQLAEPVWPPGIELVDFEPALIDGIHQLIYLDSGWAEVPGHPDRALADWRRIFVTDKEVPAQQVLAARDGGLVGVAMGRIFSDGAGWVAQLAVAKSERGRGLGRALLLESLRRRIAAGASVVGLSVEAVNRTAIGLYLDVGLTIDREWQKFAAPS